MTDTKAGNGTEVVNMGVSMAPGHPGENPEARRARRAAVRKPTNVGLDQLLGHYLPAMAPAAQVSILHRASGVLMFLIGIPFMLYLLSRASPPSPASRPTRPWSIPGLANSFFWC